MGPSWSKAAFQRSSGIVLVDLYDFVLSHTELG